MRISILFAFVGSLSSLGSASSLYARTNETPQVVGKTDDGKKIVNYQNSIPADSSEAMRQGKKFSLVVEPIGFAVGVIPSFGAAAGMYLDSNSIVEASYVKGGIDFLFIEIESSLAEVRWKQFFGNSFYMNLGAGYRTITFKATLEPITGNDDISSQFDVNSFGASIGIGNRWQWDNFTIGCDWIGYFVPFSSSGDSDVGNEADPVDKADLEDSVDRIGKSASSQLLRFYLGVSI